MSLVFGAIVASWSVRFEIQRAERLGFVDDRDFHEIVRTFTTEQGEARAEESQ